MKDSMKPAEEKKLLLAILSQLGSERPWGLLRRVKWKLASWCLTFLIVITAYCTIYDPDPSKVALAVMSFVCGFGVGIAAWKVAAVRQWPALAKCIDRDKVEARLGELDA
jgi:hypothetical protein